MSLTKTKLCNLALSKLGSDRLLLSDFDNDSGVLKETVDLHYDTTLEELVRMHRWNCCTSRSKLTNSTTTDPKVPLFEYKEQHSLPANFVRAIYVSDTDEVFEYGRSRVNYIIDSNKLLSNCPNIWMHYDRVPSVSEMDALFVQAFATLLAARLAVSITGSRDLYLSLLEEFNTVIMPEARRVNAFDNRELPLVDSAWLEATYTSGSSYSNSYPPFSQTSYGSFS